MPQAHSSTVTRTKRPRREGSHGLPMVLFPWLCLRRRPCDHTSPAQATSPCRFLPPCVLIPPLAAATAARERAAFHVSSRHGPSIPPPWPVSGAASVSPTLSHSSAPAAPRVSASWYAGGKSCGTSGREPAAAATPPRSYTAC